MAESQRSDWTATNIAYLALMTFGYIFGEIAHFLINTTSKEVARGKISCINLNTHCGQIKQTFFEVKFKLRFVIWL